MSLPFILRRSHDTFDSEGISSTTETVHGLLRIDGDNLVIQWRLARQVDLFGQEMRSDQEVEAVREIAVPLAGVAGAVVRRRWWRPWAAPRLVLTATDLRTFEQVAGEGGLGLSHPAELVLRLRRGDHLPAEEFAAELALAVAELAMAKAADRRALEASRRHLPSAGMESDAATDRSRED